jgi:hypothetical protein
MKVSGQLHVPAALTPKTPVPTRWEAEKIFCPCWEPNPDRRYTNWAIPAPMNKLENTELVWTHDRI